MTVDLKYKYIYIPIFRVIARTRKLVSLAIIYYYIIIISIIIFIYKNNYNNNKLYTGCIYNNMNQFYTVLLLLLLLFYARWGGEEGGRGGKGGRGGGEEGGRGGRREGGKQREEGRRGRKRMSESWPQAAYTTWNNSTNFHHLTRSSDCMLEAIYIPLYNALLYSVCLTYQTDLQSLFVIVISLSFSTYLLSLCTVKQ